MQNEDYLLRQIRMLQSIFKKLLSYLLDVGKDEAPQVILDQVTKAFSQDLGLTPEDWLEVAPAALWKTLSANNSELLQHPELLAQFFHQLGNRLLEAGDSSTGIDLLQKSLVLYHKVNEVEKSFSFERNQLILEIEQQIDLNH